MNTGKTNDEYFMKRCLKLAAKGRGMVNPNPMVGAVIVKNNRIIGEGWHKKYGGAHAEVNAIGSAVESVEGATIYCSLEPCCHYKKQTPPCVPLIITSKIKKVVVASLDPNPEVNGLGIRQLRDAGIEVEFGLLEDEAKELNKFYFKYVTEKIPYVTLKIAQSLDGKISIARNKQTWLTGEKARRFVHQQRAIHDAVLVGTNTVKVDNPLLNVRDVKGRNPYRIILDGNLTVPVKSKIFKPDDVEKTWIITSTNADESKVKRIEKTGAKVFLLPPNANGKLSLKRVLKLLAKEKITSLFVEGGQDIFSQFISQKYFDEIMILQSPLILGKGINSVSLKGKIKLTIKNSKKLGEDLLITLIPNN